MTQLWARHALLADGWASDVLIGWDEAGSIDAICAGSPAPLGVERAELVVPGMINLHSHAFQRAMAGLAEMSGTGADGDSFWTWRELMYRYAGRITPEQLHAIAAQLYADCLRHGYTAVCEFHYLHRAQDGSAYASPAAMAHTVAEAARQTGIGMTMLPVLYSHGGFGGQPLSVRQRRFASTVDEVLAMVDSLGSRRNGQFEVGAAPHSLRAASLSEIGELARGVPDGRPLHMHIAEQIAEVEACVAHLGQRPVAALLASHDVEARWCLVHATHLDASEVAALAASAAVAGVCPSTEANLGDGLFPLADYLAAGGRFGIGSDSHVGCSPVEELRWLEYGQRLRAQRRNIAIGSSQRRVADFLWRGALQGGAQASGRAVGMLAPGRRADLLVLDHEHPNLAGVTPDEVLGMLVFAGNDPLVRHVLAGGSWVVRDGRHHQQSGIAARYLAAVAQLRSDLP